MRAVNLIPAELRGGGRAPSRTGIAPYAVLGVLALLVVMASAYTLTTRSLGSKRTQVTTLQEQAAAAEARSASNKSYTDFSQMAAQRSQTVKSLAASRFDWAHAIAEVARVLPHDAWLSSIRATVTPGVAVDGSPDPLRQSLPVPAIELSGCTTSQANVARVVAGLRSADGVTRVSLSSAKKTDSATGAKSAQTEAASAGSASDCTQGNATRPKFSLTLFYDAPATPAAATASATTTATGSTPAGTSTTPPATGATTTGSTTTAPAGSAATTTGG
jgi:Tfp pilus assembly protein PilN